MKNKKINFIIHMPIEVLIETIGDIIDWSIDSEDIIFEIRQVLFEMLDNGIICEHPLKNADISEIKKILMTELKIKEGQITINDNVICVAVDNANNNKLLYIMNVLGYYDDVIEDKDNITLYYFKSKF